MPAAGATPAVERGLLVKLSVLMFLEYAIKGAWLPLFYQFLTIHRGFTGAEFGWLIAISASGAIAAPFVAGQIADRYFNTEKFLALCHVLGTVLVWHLSTVTTFAGFVLFGICYSILYSPTVALTNSISFHHLADRDRDFGKVRLWGTIGWIAAGIGIGQWLLYAHTPAPAQAAQAAAEEVRDMTAGDKAKAAEAALQARADSRKGLTADTVERILIEHQAVQVVRKARAAGMADSFRLSAILGFLLGLFCLALPKTPPMRGRRTFAPWEAIEQVKRPPLRILFLVAFPISVVHQFYFVRTAGFLNTIETGAGQWINRIFGVGGGGLMTIGQVAEIAVLAAMPLVAKRLSRKTMLIAGLAAYIARFAVFAYLPYPAAVIPALALHGICYGCFFFVAFLIVDEETTPDVRASAQGLFNLVILALGVIVGNIFAGQMDAVVRTPAGTNYALLFTVPMVLTAVCLAALVIFYPRRRGEA